MLETIREYARERLDVSRRDELRATPRRLLRGGRRAGVRAPLRRRGRVVGTARDRPRRSPRRPRLARGRTTPTPRSSSPVRSAGSGCRAGCWRKGPGAFRKHSRRRATAGAHVARALTAAGALTARQGDVERGREQLEEALRLWRELGDRDELASALDSLGWPLIYDAGDEGRRAGGVRGSPRDPPRARRRSRRDSRPRRRAQVLVALDEVERAETIARELLERAAGDDPRTEHFALPLPRRLRVDSRRHGGGREAVPREPARRASTRRRDRDELRGAGRRDGCRGQRRRRERRCAWPRPSRRLWESLGISISIPFWDTLLERYLGPAREQLGVGADAVWAEGRALEFDDAVELALFETS